VGYINVPRITIGTEVVEEFRVAATVGLDCFEGIVTGSRFVVDHAECFDASARAEFYCNEVAAVAPIFLGESGIGECVLGVEDYHVSVAVEVKEGVVVVVEVILMFRVRGDDYDFPVFLAAITIGDTGVFLLNGGDVEAGDVK